MLDRSRRLHLEKDFQRVWRGGAVSRGRYCVVRRLPSTTPPARVGFVVSKAVAKRATARNLMKRRFRAAVRQLPSLSPADIVIYGTRQATTASYAAIAEEIRTLLTTPHASPPHRRH